MTYQVFWELYPNKLLYDLQKTTKLVIPKGTIPKNAMPRSLNCSLFAKRVSLDKDGREVCKPLESMDTQPK